MADRKKRILFVGEATPLHTGYAGYGRELLTRLARQGEFEFGEMGSYLHNAHSIFRDPRDNRVIEIPWPFFSAMPDNEPEAQTYNDNPLNQFGGWKFEETLLRVQPDIVASWRDYWMDSFLFDSPFRKCYHLVTMPTIDSYPLQDSWVADYTNADIVFSYTDWGADLLKKQSGGKANVWGSASPGADFGSFSIVPNKKVHKEAWGLPPDSFVVGFFSRNQKRKYFPGFFEGFVKFLGAAPPEMAAKSYLYLHTCYPDVGWNIPELIKEFQLSGRVFMTYICRNCNEAFVTPYNDVRTACKKCGSTGVTFPNSQMGVDTKVLSELYNLLDVHVQYALNEGFGISQVEAAACGVHLMSVEYSGMIDPIKKLGAWPIKYKALVREAETNAYKAIPDSDNLAAQLLRYSALSPSEKRKLSFTTRLACEKYYNWQDTANKWASAFHSLTPKNNWGATPKIHQINTSAPPDLSEVDFVRWSLINTAGRPDLINSYTEMRLVRELQWGCSQGVNGGLVYSDMSMIGQQERYQQFTRQDVINQCVQMAERFNHWESRRSQLCRHNN